MEDSNNEQISSTHALQVQTSFAITNNADSSQLADSLFNSLPDLVIAEGIDFPRIAAEAGKPSSHPLKTHHQQDQTKPPQT